MIDQGGHKDKKPEPIGFLGEPIDALDAPESYICNVLYDWWLASKGNRAMPSRPELDPKDLIKILPYIYMVDIVNGGDEYVIRLHGTALAEMMGVDCTGLRLWRDKETGQFGKAWRGKIYDQVYKNRMPVFYKFHLGDFGKNHIVTENILLPMSDKNGDFSILLCASAPVR